MRNDGLAVFGAFKPGKTTRPVSAGCIGVAWVITERPDTKNNPARLGESPIVWLSWLPASGGCFSKARVTFHQPVFSLRFPSRCERQRLLIWVFGRSGGSKARPTGSSFPFPHHSKHPLWERGPPPCPPYPGRKPRGQ